MPKTTKKPKKKSKPKTKTKPKSKQRKGTCWKGYHRVGGTTQYAKGSCAKN
jgi:hypothetical protein